MRARFVRFASKWLLPLAVGICLLAPVQAARQLGVHTDRPSAVSGTAHVVDGDTLVIDDVRIRLEGIDAPELGQSCGRALVGTWGCGVEAKAHLQRLIGPAPVTCAGRGTDVYGRLLGHCSVPGTDLNAAMVRDGYAWAFVKYSSIFVDVEADARRRRVGVWQGDADPPWTYREQRWQAEAPAAPSGCAIKGKITRNGQIYHTPWSPWYGLSKIDERRGERWFCTEAEAVAAGWRPAGARW